MRFELRLIAVAALLLIVIIASCRHQSIAATGRGEFFGDDVAKDARSARAIAGS